MGATFKVGQRTILRSWTCSWRNPDWASSWSTWCRKKILEKDIYRRRYLTEQPFIFNFSSAPGCREEVVLFPWERSSLIWLAAGEGRRAVWGLWDWRHCQPQGCWRDPDLGLEIPQRMVALNVSGEEKAQSVPTVLYCHNCTDAVLQLHMPPPPPPVSCPASFLLSLFCSLLLSHLWHLGLTLSHSTTRSIPHPPLCLIHA